MIDEKPVFVGFSGSSYKLGISLMRLSHLPAILLLSAVPGDLVLHAAGSGFETEVLPILEAHCHKCHGPDKQSGGLRLDRGAAARSGGDSGIAAIVSGKPEESELLVRILSTKEDERMPSKGKRLDPAEIEVLREWIAAGADWPGADRSEDPASVKIEHWSFQPLSETAVPGPPLAIGENPIDRFLATARSAAGIDPAPPASPEVLLRRLSYDLTGLPPDPDEVRRFLEASADPVTADSAYAETAERLLASPAHGERWARHWLDWARYADTAGDNSDFPIPQAYLYRNYVIEAFNDDLPYDRFLTEQLAGDLLPAAGESERRRLVIATGYLAMSRRFGSLVERYPQHLTIEDTIDNLGRTVFGLTLSCARCHDHKFDPISTRDYYGLYGFFASTRYPFPGIELFQTQRDFVPLVTAEEVKRAWGPFEEETKHLTNAMEKALAECQDEAIELAALESKLPVEELRKRREQLDGRLFQARKAGEKLAAHLKKLPPLETAYAVQDGTPANARVQLRGEPDLPGVEVPRKFPDVLGGMVLDEVVASSGSGRLELAGWITSPANPLTARVIVNRVWQRHFGTGIVPGEGDFGLRGETPTHPELLDWLARDLIDHGWSLRHLHRRIVTSQAYRRSSAAAAEGLARDPDNHTYWRYPRQRLDAESLRDTLLLLGGTLDRSPQTEPYPIPPSQDWKYTQHHPFKGDYPSPKRTIYQMTKRLTVDAYPQTFDGPDPNVCTSTRDRSVTSLQALFFVNDPFVHDQAEGFGRALLSREDDDEARLDHAFLAALGRLPDPEEAAWMLEHLAACRKDGAADDVAWASVARSLFRLNEFLYLD